MAFLDLKSFFLVRFPKNLKYLLAKLNRCFTFLALGYFLVLCFNIASSLTFIIIPTCHILLCGYFLVL